MNYPYAFFALIGLVFLLTACPPDTRPSDPEPGPADDGGTSKPAEADAVDCEEERKRLDECLEPKGEPK